MRFILTICIALILVVSSNSQSGRVISKKEISADLEFSEEKTAKQILEEINEQSKQKLQTLITQKKGNLSREDLVRLEKETAELAARSAAIVEAKQNKLAEDWFYLALIFVTAKKFDDAKRSFENFLEKPESKTQEFAEQRRTAYATLSVIAATKDNLEEAESWFSKYLENRVENQLEEMGIRLLLAERYEQKGKYEDVLAHAERGYILAKKLASQPNNRSSLIDEVIVLNEMIFRAYAEIRKSQKALETLDDLQRTAVFIES
ncbi:MAG: hypothetical protein ACK419_02880, partial [Pyrinomonadaceae bacterium]